LLIDCETCQVRDLACEDCVVSVLLGPTRWADEPDREAAGVALAGPLGAGPPSAKRLSATHPTPATPTDAPGESISLDAAERTALAVLAASGLVPPLRLVPGSGSSSPTPSPNDPAAAEFRAPRRAIHRPGTDVDVPESTDNAM
jgi:hypothetical protein